MLLKEDWTQAYLSTLMANQFILKVGVFKCQLHVKLQLLEITN